MNIIISGCAGFIGTKVCQFLLERGDFVFGVDDLSDGYDVKLKLHRLNALSEHKKFQFFRCDISQNLELVSVYKEIKKVCSGGSVSCVVNLAARAGVRESINDPWIYFSTNVIGTLNLLELCRTEEIEKFVLASTSSVYGDNDPPFSEDMRTDFQLSPYGSSKKSAESICSVYNSLYGTDISILRYFTVYGPAGRPDMSIFRFIRWIEEGEEVTILGDGKQKRDFTYVDDIAEGTVAAIKSLGFEIINLGSSAPLSLNEIIEVIEQVTGKKAKTNCGVAHPSDPKITQASVEKAKRVLGWRPRFDIETGIGNSVAWYEENREFARSIEM